MVFVGMNMLKTRGQLAIGRFAQPMACTQIGLGLISIIIIEGKMKLL
jgi:hypothetical protein